MVERMYDAPLRVTVPGTTTFLKRTFRIENNFPFALRQLEFLTTHVTTTVRVRRVDGSYIQSAGVNRGGVFMLGNANVNFAPIQPEEVYPAHGAIEVDFSNSQALADVTRLLFRGVQFVPDEVELRYTWPARYRLQRFDYVNYDVIQNVETLRNRSRTVAGDADFLMMGVTSAQDNNQDTPIDLRYQFMSEWGWAYSSQPIDRLWLMGNYTPQSPRPFVPPIIVPRNGSLYYNMVRNDGAGVQARIMTRFVGYKIKEVCS